MRIIRGSLIVVTMLVAAGTVGAQRPRYTSPEAHSSVAVGGKRITVDYYAPSMHGRKIMGALVPYGEVWCTGANIATGFTTEATLQMGGLRLPAGAYSIWTLPGEKEWTLIVNKETGQFHLNYDGSKDFGRTKMLLRPVSPAVETFRVDLKATGGNQGEMALVWENTAAYLPFTVVP